MRFLWFENALLHETVTKIDKSAILSASYSIPVNTKPKCTVCNFKSNESDVTNTIDRPRPISQSDNIPVDRRNKIEETRSASAVATSRVCFHQFHAIVTHRRRCYRRRRVNERDCFDNRIWRLPEISHGYPRKTHDSGSSK